MSDWRILMAPASWLRAHGLSLGCVVVIEAPEIGFGEYRVDLMVKTYKDACLLPYCFIQVDKPPEFASARKQVLSEHIDIFFKGGCGVFRKETLVYHCGIQGHACKAF